MATKMNQKSKQMEKTIDDFIDFSTVTSEWRPYLRDDFVRRLLTGDITKNGTDFSDTIAYDFLVTEMQKAEDTMSDTYHNPVIPKLESGIEECVSGPIKHLGNLKDSIHDLEVIGMVAGFVYQLHEKYPEFEQGGDLGIYQKIMTSMRKRINEKALLYFQTLEDLRKEGIVRRKGFLGGVGNALEFLPHENKYNGGKRKNPDLSDIGFWKWRAFNSYWSIKGSKKQIKPIEFYDLFTPSIYDNVTIRHEKPMSEIVQYLGRSE